MTDETAVPVAVVVPVHNGWSVVEPCLRSIPDGVETIVVDDCSTDDTPQRIAEAFPAVQLLHNPTNRGFAATANRGLHATDAAVRVVLNSDARLTPGALGAMASLFEADGVGVVGARLVFPGGTHQTSAAHFLTPGRLVVGSFLVDEVLRRLRPRRRRSYGVGLSRAEHEGSPEVDWVHGTCIAVSDKCLQELGGFDEGYRFYCEEIDLCWRAHRAGWQVRLAGDAVVEHVGGASTPGDIGARARQYLESEARFFTVAYGPDSLPRWRRARIVGSLAKAMLLAPASLVDRRVRVRWRWQLAALGAALRGEVRPQR